MGSKRTNFGVSWAIWLWKRVPMSSSLPHMSFLYFFPFYLFIPYMSSKLHVYIYIYTYVHTKRIIMIKPTTGTRDANSRSTWESMVVFSFYSLSMSLKKKNSMMKVILWVKLYTFNLLEEFYLSSTFWSYSLTEKGSSKGGKIYCKIWIHWCFFFFRSQ